MMTYLVGEIKLLPYDLVPDQWSSCNGQELAIADYPKLFMLLGTKFGGDGIHFFMLPNLINETPAKMIYCIALDGVVPSIKENRGEYG